MSNSLEASIVASVKNDSVLGPMVHSIRPMVGAQLEARPFLTYEIVSGSAQSTYGGDAIAWKKANVEFAIYGDLSTTVQDITNELMRIFHGTVITTATAMIRPSMLDDESDIEQAIEPGKGTPVYIRTLTFRMNYRILS